MSKLLFKVHPYGQQTTIGEVEHLKNPSLKNMYQFYETYYVPNNMAICLSGDISIPDTIRLIDEQFSVLKRKDLPPAKHWEEKPLKGAERVTVNYEGEEYALLAFRTADFKSPDADALKLFDMILDNATAGLINLNLNHEQKVPQAGSMLELLNDYGAEFLFGVPKKGQSLQQVESLLLDQVALVKKGEFEDWVLPAIVSDFKKRRKAGLESDVARVARMREAFIRFEDWDQEMNEIPRLEKLTKADVVRVANAYFGTNYIAGYRVDAQHEVPHVDKPQIDKINIDPKRESKFFQEVMSIPVKPLEPVFVDPNKDYQISRYGEGVKFYYTKNPINDLFSFSIEVGLGHHQDKKISAASLLLDKAGTAKFSPEDLQKKW